MAYSRNLADRVRAATRDLRGMVEKKMFGGVGFLLRGNMLVGIMGSSLIVRLGPEAAATALQQDGVREFDVTGKPMRGWVVVEPDALESERELAAWIDRAASFVETLPAK